MADFKIDRIRFRWRNVWAISTTYVKDDIVIYNGKAYVCIVGHGSDSSNFYIDFNTAKWELMFDGYVWSGDWQASTFYALDDIIKWKGYIYRCTVPHSSTAAVNQGPDANISNWTLVATTYNWLDEWTVNTYYNKGDIVRYNGITYICNTKHQSNATATSGLEADQSKWTIVTRSDHWSGNWSVSTRYKVDDVVKYGGTVYRCIEAHSSAATVSLGLEADQSKWTSVIIGIEYKYDWTATTRYKVGDIVKWGPTPWICVQEHTSQTTLRSDEAKWNVWLPGLGYELVWDPATEYQKGDIVLYGGYTYTALTNNINSNPSVNGLTQNTGDWELLKQGYRHRGEWANAVTYKTGDVVRNRGHLYICVVDTSGASPDHLIQWARLVPGMYWMAEWVPSIRYYLGDVVTFESTAYYCINSHIPTSVDTPKADITNTNWILYIQGTSTNVLTTRGDLRTHNGTATVRFPVGSSGNTLKSVNNSLLWENFEEIDKVYYVATTGTDAPSFGKTVNAPFRTVKYACEYILADQANRAPATVFIKTGIYEEILPISVPANVALVGDELRSTTIQPALGYAQSNMFYVRNGSGMRNMTLQGLNGILTSVNNEYGTLRPTAGAFVSLDPGTGPSDTSVWITSRSPYIQNITTFGSGCIGMKIDGALHNGGNRSIVANDFTQVLDDGIGYWALELGRSELVSVFTYFCYIGYLSTSGGILRATNGNNSYGVYGSRAEGVNLNETPITAQIDNRVDEADVAVVNTNSTNVLALAFGNAGQNYTAATPTIIGSGINFVANFVEFRNDAISEVRLLSTTPTNIPGGAGYQYLLNTAQGGDTASIILAAADTNEDASKYIGMRLFIDSGAGAGQYGVITAYNTLTKLATISRESDSGEGWEHIYPGYPIVSTLDNTTRYKIEPRVVVAEPTFETSTITAVAGSWNTIIKTSTTYVVINNISPFRTAYSLNSAGTSWSAAISYSSLTGVGATWTGQRVLIAVQPTNPATTNLLYYIGSTPSSYSETSITVSSLVVQPRAIASNGSGTVIMVGYTVDGGVTTTRIHRSIDHGVTWSTLDTLSTSTARRYDKIAHGNGVWVILDSNNGIGAMWYSTNNGATWQSSSTYTNFGNPLGITITDLVFGKDRFVAIGDTVSAYSFDGIVWYAGGPLGASTYSHLSYGDGVFLATGPGQTISRSQDGKHWKSFNDDSTVYTMPADATWAASIYDKSAGSWIVTKVGPSSWATISTGARPLIRAHVIGGRISQLVIYDPGSNYKTIPVIDIVDPDNDINATLSVRLADGVLSQPLFTHRGDGYVTAQMTISGDGFADKFQTGSFINLKNLSRLPGPGDNVTITGISNITFKLTNVVSSSGSEPNLTARIRITPAIGNFYSPSNSANVVIRQSYSQVRLTGHDFLDIGTGNKASTDYPDLYVFGQTSQNEPQQANEVTEAGGGRVFYTSTDQDGNFRVGELFRVEQSTGIVTVNAEYFDLQGLTELSLGGIQVGGTTVVIREFSKDAAFTANSNNIVPTQKAIKSYLESRITSGGADAVTNTLIAGQVRITSTNINTTSGFPINIPVLVNQTKLISGDYLISQYFSFGARS